jgi:hypothetical protein
MPLVFVSHSAADSVLVDPFVDTILKLGCGLDETEIFYSSGEDTGVPSGSDLLHHVRQEVEEAGLVVAVISPMFQTRPACVAELGAAWSRTGNLFPLAVPGMARPDMEGVLQGMAVRYVDDAAALDELHDRVSALREEHSKTTTWGRHKATWLANVGAYAERLATPTIITAQELERVREELGDTQGALAESERERRGLEERLQRVAAASTPEERREALLPEEDSERFDALVAAADQAVGKLDSIVIDALFAEISEGSMDWPNSFDDHHRYEQATKAVQNGDLVEDANGRLVPDDEIRDVARASGAIRALRTFLEEESGEEFDGWFREQFGGPPDLTKRRIFDRVIG